MWIASIMAALAIISGSPNIESYVIKTAEAKSCPVNVVMGILIKESNLNQKARGKDGEVGVAQFMPSTFKWMKKEAGMPELKITSEKDQIRLLCWAIENGYESHWTTLSGVLHNINKANEP